MALTAYKTFTNGDGSPAGKCFPTDLNAIQQQYRDWFNTYAPSETVDTLPGSPEDGQIVLFQNAAMATAGVVWPLRYNDGSASTYKWELAGGVPLLDEVATQEATSSAAYADLATVGPAVTAPLAGEYIVRLTAFMGVTSPEAANMSFAKGATPADAGDSIQSSIWAINTVTPTAGSLSGSYSRELRTTITAAATALTAKYRNPGAGGVTFAERSLSILPVRVA